MLREGVFSRVCQFVGGRGGTRVTITHYAGADPRFSVGGSDNPSRGTNMWFCKIFQKKKLHKIENYWAMGVVHMPGGGPLRSAMAYCAGKR